MLKARLRSLVRNLCAKKLDYPKKKILEESLEEEYKILRQETTNTYVNEVCYSLFFGEKESALIRGFYNGDASFHLHRIENTACDGKGLKYLPKLFNALEKNLSEEGIKYMTTLALLKLAPIEVKRYGFYSLRGKSYQELKKSKLKNIPLLTTPLRKDL